MLVATCFESTFTDLMMGLMRQGKHNKCCGENKVIFDRQMCMNDT